MQQKIYCKNSTQNCRYRESLKEKVLGFIKKLLEIPQGVKCEENQGELEKVHKGSFEKNDDPMGSFHTDVISLVESILSYLAPIRHSVSLSKKCRLPV